MAYRSTQQLCAHGLGAGNCGSDDFELLARLFPRVSGHAANRGIAGCGTIFTRCLYGRFCSIPLALWTANGGGRGYVSYLSGRVGGILVLLYFYRRQRHLRAKLLAEQATDIIPESSWQIMKRLFVLAIPVSMANIMMPIVSGIDLGVVPQRLIDAAIPFAKQPPYSVI